MAKQPAIEIILYQNNELLELNQYYNKNIEQETIVSEAEEKVKKIRQISQGSTKQIVRVVESKGKGTKIKNTGQIIRYNPKNNLEMNWKMKNAEKVFIVGDSMIKNITGTGILRTNTDKMRPDPGATTVDLCNYIKLELRLRRKPDVIIIHSRTNDIENEINTVKKKSRSQRRLMNMTKRIHLKLPYQV